MLRTGIFASPDRLLLDRVPAYPAIPGQLVVWTRHIVCSKCNAVNIANDNHKLYQMLGSDEAGGGQPCTGRRPSGWVACRSLLPTANRGCFKRLIAFVRWACVHIVCLCLCHRLPGELVASRVGLAVVLCKKASPLPQSQLHKSMGFRLPSPLFQWGLQ